MEEAKAKTVAELAQEELIREKTRDAVKALKKLYAKLADAEKIVRNIKREIADFEEELDS